MSGLKWTEWVKSWKGRPVADRDAQNEPDLRQEAISLACLQRLWPEGAAEEQSRDDYSGQSAEPWVHGLF